MYVREITEAFQSLVVFGLKHLGRFAQNYVMVIKAI